MKRYTFALVFLTVFVLASSGLHAQADIGVKGVGGKLSFVSPSDIDGTIGFGGFVDLGSITPEIGLEAGIDYWSKSMDAFGVESSFRDIILSARAKYGFELSNPQVKPYAGGGLAIHLFKSEVSTPSVSAFGVTVGGDYEDSSTKIGVDLIGGIGYEVSEKVDIVGEAMYRIVSDVGQFVISGGLVYWLGE